MILTEIIFTKSKCWTKVIHLFECEEKFSPAKIFLDLIFIDITLPNGIILLVTKHNGNFEKVLFSSTNITGKNILSLINIFFGPIRYIGLLDLIKNIFH